MTKGRPEKIAEAASLIRQAEFLAVLTGAGISAESGVPTFRGSPPPTPNADGSTPGASQSAPLLMPLWGRFSPEQLATPEAFASNPRLVWDWYLWRRSLIAQCLPNPAHLVLARIEKEILSRDGRHFLLITQNIDGLHARGGSQRILELHGNIWRVKCSRCTALAGPVAGIWSRTLTFEESTPPRCQCGGWLRPDVVWFGESLDPAILSEAFSAASSCDLMLVIGTSAVVQPAASLPFMTLEREGKVIEINAEKTPLTSFASLSLPGRAGEILPKIWEACLT